MSKSYYVWEEKQPVSPEKVIRHEVHECFVTKEMIKPEDDAYWTSEFDAWISERGYQMIQNAHSTGELENTLPWAAVFGEWYAKEEAQIGLEEQWHSEWSSHMEAKYGYRHDEL